MHCNTKRPLASKTSFEGTLPKPSLNQEAYLQARDKKTAEETGQLWAGKLITTLWNSFQRTGNSVATNNTRKTKVMSLNNTPSVHTPTLGPSTHCSPIFPLPCALYIGSTSPSTSKSKPTLPSLNYGLPIQNHRPKRPSQKRPATS